MFSLDSEINAIKTATPKTIEEAAIRDVKVISSIVSDYNHGFFQQKRPTSNSEQEQSFYPDEGSTPIVTVGILFRDAKIFNTIQFI